jgi:hypothetical protein
MLVMAARCDPASRCEPSGSESAAAYVECASLADIRGTNMTWLDAGMRALLLARGAATRRLRRELNSLTIGIKLSDGCIDELARAADHGARRALSSGAGARSYVELLREQLGVQANWVRRWTSTDEKVPDDDPVAQAVVRIARKYALPRPWKLTEPVAVEVPRARIGWRWAAGLSAQVASQG